ncbi:hypothetical protein AOL_s00079g452 [Orbilia oligospora ATCC 24927]|uniref:Glucose receptor Git3-like N-terminal domain-containing protein n=2 Tax=Orbilia oligospora TaxID=2813651 RepID=G1XDR7_ARTOA|nr:hypothetical protein AOL_s00079g452 [Orbilia oligospora ATCC 24927]EGX48813.1 hypothetical protein AOL_s00079g452 [Orbilia oligospora ATCC 24927]KAF3287323.1 hypothetical protein TWF970_007050 [Orbilia oligospora]
MAFTTLSFTIAVLNLIGSLSSFLGSGFIVVTYLLLPIKRHFRHSLILNLAIADFINSSNNSTSGLWRLINRREIPDSPGCVANGFLGQLSVQATDTSILAIAIVTVWSLTRKTTICETLPRTTTALICAATWILPMTTSFITLGMNRYGPVSGNWCWIKAEPSYFRYVMTHGWRFAFIFCEIVMYTYLHFYIRKRFGAFLDASRCSSHTGRSTVRDVGTEFRNDSMAIRLDSVAARNDSLAPAEGPQRSDSQMPFSIADEGDIRPVGARGQDLESGEAYVRTEVWISETYDDKTLPAHAVTTTISSANNSLDRPATDLRPETANTIESRRPKFSNPFAHRRADEDDHLADVDVHDENERKIRQQNASRSRRVRRILLLNAYPAMYILLWIPGIINRLIEASGGKSSVMQIMQASTQFVGLANAITYGWNERVWRQLKDHIADRWGSDRKRSVEELAVQKVELENRLRVGLKGSKERLREIRDGLRSPNKRDDDELPLDNHGQLMYINGAWQWSQTASINSQDGDADDREASRDPEPRRE